jgi:DNA (cytosine-5)-methyltransferase 1
MVRKAKNDVALFEGSREPVQPGDGGGLRELALFAGAGGGILGGLLLGWRTVAAVELNEYCARVLMERQNEGHLPPFPIWDDVRTFDGGPWRGLVDVVSGGFPCQDISCARKTLRGDKSRGLDGERSGLWFEYARIINEIRPRYALIENSSMLVKHGLNRILGGLAEMGYDAEWGCFTASSLGASHKRERIFILAHDADCTRLQGRERCLFTKPQHVSGLSSQNAAMAPNTDSSTTQRCALSFNKARPKNEDTHTDSVRQLLSKVKGVFPRTLLHLPEPRVLRSGHGMANLLDRSNAVGNGQVPLVAATAWCVLRARLEESER